MVIELVILSLLRSAHILQELFEPQPSLVWDFTRLFPQVVSVNIGANHGPHICSESSQEGLPNGVLLDLFQEDWVDVLVLVYLLASPSIVKHEANIIIHFVHIRNTIDLHGIYTQWTLLVFDIWYYWSSFSLIKLSGLKLVRISTRMMFSRGLWIEASTEIFTIPII